MKTIKITKIAPEARAVLNEKNIKLRVGQTLRLKNAQKTIIKSNEIASWERGERNHWKPLFIAVLIDRNGQVYLGRSY